MDAGTSSARTARTQHRHELRTLTYITLDEGNGGIVRNLSSEGIGLQMVAAPRPQQRVWLRFGLQSPRVRVEAHGEVMWATLSGQCGIRFVDLSPRTSRQIGEWIFGDLLLGAEMHSRSAEWMFGARAEAEEEDGLMVSAAQVKVIELPLPAEELEARGAASDDSLHLDWLSQPLSGRGLAWTVNALVVFAALLLFVFVFLSVNRAAPEWPATLMIGAALVVAGLYWGFFQLFGGGSLGERLARMVVADSEDEERDARFR